MLLRMPSWRSCITSLPVGSRASRDARDVDRDHVAAGFLRRHRDRRSSTAADGTLDDDHGRLERAKRIYDACDPRLLSRVEPGAERHGDASTGAADQLFGIVVALQ